MKARVAASGLIALLCSGCFGAGIDVVRYDGTPKTMTGVPWNLGLTSFKVTITRRVTGCGDQLNGTVEATVEPATLRIDPDQMFMLSSDAWISKSTIKGTYGADGVSTGLNTTSDGQAGLVLSNVVGAIATITPMLAAAAGPGEACHLDVVKALETLEAQPLDADGKPTPKLADLVKSQGSALARLTTTVTHLSAQATALGAAATDGDRRALRDAIKAMTDMTVTLAENEAKLDAALKVITHVTTVEWPNVGSGLSTKTPFGLDPTFFTTKWATVQRPEESIRRFDVYLDLRLKDATVPGGGRQSAIDVRRGVPLRFAQTGVVRVCVALTCDNAATKVIKSFEAPVLQLGRVVTVPVSGGAWRSTTAGVVMTAGNPTTIEIGNAVSLGESVTGFSARTATTAAGLPAAINAAELARTQARTNQQLAENALLAAMAQSATAAELAPLQAETALTTARTAQLAAQAALVTAQNASQP